MAAIGREGGRR